MVISSYSTFPNANAKVYFNSARSKTACIEKLLNLPLIAGSCWKSWIHQQRCSKRRFSRSAPIPRAALLFIFSSPYHFLLSTYHMSLTVKQTLPEKTFSIENHATPIENPRTPVRYGDVARAATLGPGFEWRWPSSRLALQTYNTINVVQSTFGPNAYKQPTQAGQLRLNSLANE